MKKIPPLKKIVIYVIMACFAEFAYASTGFTYNDFTYNIIDPTNKIVEVTSYLGSNASIELLTEVVSPVDGETYAVEKIADDAFNGSHIAAITLPLSIKTIGVSAFANCQNLVIISLPTSGETISNYAFFNCSNLKDVSFGDVKEIGVNAFEGCSSISVLDLPQNLSIIRNGAFTNCTSLTTLNIPRDLSMLYANTFKGCNKI